MTAFVDTSIVVRYLMGDEPAQLEHAKHIIDTKQLTVTPVILAEVAFVITSFYEVPREVTVDKLIDLLGKVNIGTVGLSKDQAVEALLLCRPSKRVSFADALLWAEARAAAGGRERAVIYAFDRRFPATGIELRGQ